MIKNFQKRWQNSIKIIDTAGEEQSEKCLRQSHIRPKGFLKNETWSNKYRIKKNNCQTQKSEAEHPRSISNWHRDSAKRTSANINDIHRNFHQLQLYDETSCNYRKCNNCGGRIIINIMRAVFVVVLLAVNFCSNQ